MRTNVRELLVSSQLSSAGETLTNIITLPRHDQSGQRKHTRTTRSICALGVTAQRVGQQVGEIRVAVGYVAAPLLPLCLAQAVDHIPLPTQAP